MSGAITVTKLNWRGERVYSWQGDVVVREPGHVVLRALWSGPGTVQVGDEVWFERGDVFYEHYFDRRPFGLCKIMTPYEARLKCWYCNVSTPAEVGDDTITFRDLLLDVLLLPDGTRHVLDRDELDCALADGLAPALAALAHDAVREVLAMIDGGVPPFEE